ncbi:MAG: uroporphyrinogen-III C-methyltransferase [Robiginitomaculum sp.]|nr:MAG: uroporphyrinogen-III C-methyltransferase [Robiginitomaculum sp.]
MRYLPIHIDLQHTDILIVGGGAMAEAKLRTLLTTPARLFVIADSISQNIQDWAKAGKLSWESRAFSPADLDGKQLVYAASGNSVQDKAVAKLAKRRGLLVNAADDKVGSNFFSPAIVDRSPVSVSIGTEGQSPGMARLIKSEIEALLPASLGKTTEYLGAVRKTLPQKRPQFSSRLSFWKAMFKAQSLASLCALDQASIADKAEDLLNSDETISPQSHKGRVTLVGGGPGNPDLLTRQAVRALEAADVIVYDRLISKAVLALGRREAEYIYVGKEPNGPSAPQESINAVLIKYAQEGHHVVRLKGGDPLIFGRADEELAALDAANIPFDIYPGITAASASAASIGRSLTTRGVNTALTLLSGHDAKGYVEHDWAQLALPAARAVIYMGLGASSRIRAQLLSHGARPDTPVTIVENASLPTQKIVGSSLEMLSSDITRGDITGPAILMLGYTPRLAKRPSKAPQTQLANIREQEHEQQKTHGHKNTHGQQKTQRHGLASRNGQRPAQRQSRVFESAISLDQSSFQGFG